MPTSKMVSSLAFTSWEPGGFPPPLQSSTLSRMESYPKPLVPTSPILSSGTLGLRRERTDIPSVLDAGVARFLTSGRVGIAWTLRLLGIGPGHKVLIPSYNCSSMVAPVQWCGAEPVYYRVSERLDIDLDDLERQLEPAVRLLMVTHYFGFPQQCEALRAFCDRKGIALLEDCAHAFFGTYAGRPLGSFGDFAIASPMKFFPTLDGGCLVSARHSLDGVQLRMGGRAFQIKSLLTPLETALEYGRLGTFGSILRPIMQAKDSLWRTLKTLRHGTAEGPERGSSFAPSSSEGGFGFDPMWFDTAMSGGSRYVMFHTSWARLVKRRRRHYQRFAEALTGLSGCRPLLPDLPDGVVPYVFPLLLADHEQSFPVLKQRGVPMLRWDSLSTEAAAHCPQSALYAHALVQLPCHQELLDDELEWMIAEIRRTLTT